MTQNRPSIKIYDVLFTPSPVIKSLGVWDDQLLLFKGDAGQAAGRTRKGCGLLTHVSNWKGESPRALHHLAHNITLPILVYGSDICWTGARHILDRLKAPYHTIDSLITGLPKWTPTNKVVCGAGLPPHDLLLDKISQKYGVRILKCAYDHLCMTLLRNRIKRAGAIGNGTGVDRIATVLAQLIPNGIALEDQDHPLPSELPMTREPHISQDPKEVKALNHLNRLPSLPASATRVYTDGSKNKVNNKLCGWHAIQEHKVTL